MHISKLKLLFVLLFTIIGSPILSFASHMIGGQVSYTCLGNNRFRFTITIYQDCLDGQATAIDQDNPLQYAIFENSSYDMVTEYSSVANNISFVSPEFSNDCITNFPNTCLRKQVHIFEETLQPNAAGYTIAYQRCCRNASILNIFNPGNTGVTYYATIPGFTAGTCPNNSAVFKNDPPQIICVNNPISFDFSATDADGDSLSYELGNPLDGGSINNPIPGTPGYPSITPPPYANITFIPPYTAGMPITGTPPISINPTTGLLTGTPNNVGRYVLSVYCKEWRNGNVVNILRRDLQLVITDCSKAVIANMPSFSDEPNTYIVNCTDNTVKFENSSSGGFKYDWDFGDGNTSTATTPTHTYADTGTYKVKLVVNSGTTCADSITRLVKIYPTMKASFIVEGRLCTGDTLTFTNTSQSDYADIKNFQWDFGDQTINNISPVKKSFPEGDSFLVKLYVSNNYGCKDTATKKVVFSKFEPFAGNDTIIVRGYPFNMNGSGGDYYTWVPSSYLDSPNDPKTAAHFPTAGVYEYVLNVTNESGCEGSDSIKITVVDNPFFKVPNAFTPNGDGRNDRIKPIMVGYRRLIEFKIYNRFGQLVYQTNDNKSEGWDGTVGGKQSDMGVYYWTTIAVDAFGKISEEKGDITLIR